MFDWVLTAGDTSPASGASLIDNLGNSGAQTVLLFAADGPRLDLPSLVAALSGRGVSVVGAVFPSLILGGVLITSGLVALGISARARRIVVPKLVGPQAALESAVGNLFVGSPTGLGLTVFVLIDGQYAGSSAPLLGLLHLQAHRRADYVGGGAGSLVSPDRPCLFTEREVLPRGAGVLLRIDRGTTITLEHGWQRLAGPFFASRAEGSTVLELDWRPAIEVYREALAASGISPPSDQQFSAVAKLYPLAIVKLRETLVVRDPGAMTPAGGLVTLGQIPQHSVVVILRSESDSLLAAAQRAAFEARRGALEASARPAGLAHTAFIADCVSRTDALGARFGEELIAIQRAIGFPTAGALTIGEIASQRDRAVDLHNKTVVVAAC